MILPLSILPNPKLNKNKQQKASKQTNNKTKNKTRLHERMKIHLFGHDVTEKYSSTPTNFTTTSNTELSKPNLIPSSLTLKCYSHHGFDEAVKLFAVVP